MKRLTVRSRILLLVVALAVVTAMGTVYTAHAASPEAGAGAIHAVAYHAAAASDTPCTIDYQNTTCQSTNPAVTVNNYFSGDQTGCSYGSNAYWGDGQSSTGITYTDPSDGYDLLANHTYAAAGTYTISVTLYVTAGGCTSQDFTAQFTLLTPTPQTSSPTPQTSSPSAKACPIVLLGLHGMREGPSPTDPTAKSTTGGITVVESTFQNFGTAAAATGHSAKDYKTDDVPYPITGFSDLYNPVLMRTILSDVRVGSDALQAAVEKYTAACHSSTFELVGYSEGAWVIEYWLHFHQGEAHIKAIQLYGDPNYYEAYRHDRHGVHAYQGLARLAGLTFGWFGPPYPNTPYKAQTFCIPNDPVCGKGYTESLTEYLLQFATAAKCLIPKLGCPHLDDHYLNDGYTKRGAEFLAKHAF